MVTRDARLRRFLRALLAAGVLLVTVFGIARSGSSYLYCSMAGTIGEAPCCNHGARSEPVDAVHAPEMECCQKHALPTLPTTERATARHEAPLAPFTTVLAAVPAPVLRDALRSVRPPPSARRDRAGPAPPRYASDMRAELMIFLC